MRYLMVLFGILILAACSTAPHINTEASAKSSELQKTTVDSALQFLMTSAATDFNKHRRTYPARFRNVRMGHTTTATGEKQYMLCGEFLPTEGGQSEWTPFTTIKMSDYEQWIGATVHCQDPSFKLDKADDLSAMLQSRLDSLK